MKDGRQPDQGEPMKIKYCKKYEKYVSEQHCEFFNDGNSCEFYNQTSWPSIKHLLMDDDRPKWDANAIIKPFKCNLMNRENTHQRNRARRAAKRVSVAY
jgi:hypothetical protein